MHSAWSPGRTATSIASSGYWPTESRAGASRLDDPGGAQDDGCTTMTGQVASAINPDAVRLIEARRADRSPREVSTMSDALTRAAWAASAAMGSFDARIVEVVDINLLGALAQIVVGQKCRKRSGRGNVLIQDREGQLTACSIRISKAPQARQEATTRWTLHRGDQKGLQPIG